MQDRDLLEQFVRDRSETAFREIVNRYAPMVYSSARQRLADPGQAEDISQAVFLALATKAPKLSKDTVLCGWLYRATRFAVAQHFRSESRRKEREMRAQQEDAVHASPAAGDDVSWETLAPHLAEGLDALGEQDRQAILLRFYQKRSQAEVGSVLGVSEDAARKRIARGVERLRRFFGRRGLLATTAGLTAVLSARAVEAVPDQLDASIVQAAWTGVATNAAGTTAALAKGVLNMMFWSQVKIASVAVLGAATVVATGAAVTNRLTAAPPRVLHADSPSAQGSGRVTMDLAVIPDTWPASDLKAEVQRLRQVLKDSPASEESARAHSRLEMMGLSTKDKADAVPADTPFLAVMVGNGTSSNLFLNLFDTFRPTLRDADGKETPLDGGRNGTMVPRPLSVPAGGSAVVRFPVRFLKQPARDRPSVIIDDRTGGVWVFHDLKPGIYSMYLSYKNVGAELSFGGPVRKRWPDMPAGATLWIGETTTSVATITVTATDGAGTDATEETSGDAAKRTTTTVRIPYHEQSLTADHVSMSRERHEIDAEGHVIFSNAVFVVTADAGRVRGNIETLPGAGTGISKAEWVATGNVCVAWAKRQVTCNELTFSEARAEVGMDGDTISIPGGPLDLAVLADRMFALGAAREWGAALKAQDLKRYQETFHPDARKVGEFASEEAMRFWGKQVEELRTPPSAVVRFVCSPVSKQEATDRSPEGAVRAFFTVDGRKTRNSLLLMTADDGWKVVRLDF